MEQKLIELEKSARERHVPVILDDALYELIRVVEDVKPKRILEVGTAIGYSGSIMLLNSPSDCILDTIELLSERRDEALRNFADFSLVSNVNSYLGDAMELLPQVVENNMYDLVFLDGPKSKYGQYLDIIEPHINVGGVVFCDNVLFRGLVKNGKKPPHKFRTIVVGMRKFLDRVTSSEKYDTQIIEKGDGIAIIKVIK